MIQKLIGWSNSIPSSFPVAVCCAAFGLPIANLAAAQQGFVVSTSESCGCTGSHVMIAEVAVEHAPSIGCCGSEEPIQLSSSVPFTGSDMPFDLNVLLTTQVKELTADSEKLNAELLAVAADKTKLEEDVAALRKQAEAAVAAKEELEALKIELLALKDAQKNWDTERNALKQQLTDKETKIAELKSELETKEAERLASIKMAEKEGQEDSPETPVEPNSDDNRPVEEAAPQPSVRREGEQSDQPETDPSETQDPQSEPKSDTPDSTPEVIEDQPDPVADPANDSTPPTGQPG